MQLATHSRIIARPVVALAALRRQELERWIDHAIEVLDQMDGDENLEPWLEGWDWASQRGGARDDREGDDADMGEPEETDQNGDEQDFNGDEGDHSVGRLDGGCGI